MLLERQGLVRRDAHPSDSRARTAALTVAGKKKFQQVFSAGEPIRDQMFETLQSDDAVLLVTLLNQVAASLNSQFESAVGSDSNYSHERES